MTGFPLCLGPQDAASPVKNDQPTNHGTKSAQADAGTRQNICSKVSEVTVFCSQQKFQVQDTCFCHPELGSFPNLLFLRLFRALR